MNWLRKLWGVAIFTLGYLLLASVSAVLLDNSEFLFYIIVMIVLIAGVVYVHTRVKLTNGVLWMLSVWGLLHMLGGLAPVPEGWPISGENRVLYSLWFVPGLLKYDHVVHAYGFGTTTWLCWQGLRAMLSHRRGPARPTAGLAFMAAVAALGFGALNEVVEFAATLLLPQTNVGGYINTGWDLVFNLIGASIAACALYLFSREATPPNPP